MKTRSLLTIVSGFPLKHVSPLVCLALALFLPAVAARAAQLTDGLVSYWPLDSASGGVAADSAFTNAMTIVGSPAVSPGQVGNAFTFTGPSTYLTNLHAADNASSGLPIYQAGAYTVMMWVKGANQTNKYFFAEGGLTSLNPLFILQTGNATAPNNSKLDVIIRNDAGTSLINHRVSTNVVFDNTWHHIAWVDDRGRVRLYVDGNLDPADFSYAPAGVFTLHTTALGTLVRSNNISTGAIFNGQIDEVSVWERPLSQAEVNQVRTNGIPTPIVAQVPSLYAVPADVVRRQGDWALFSVEAYGSRPYVTTYQWSRNGSPILDATKRTFQTPTGLQPVNSGDYYNVAVANAIGPAAATTNATLTVLADPAPALTNALVNYWPLDVFNENTNTPDLHFGHNMQMVGVNTNADIVPGQFSNSVFFFASPAPGTFGYRVGGTPIYSRTNYSVSLWVNGLDLQADRRVFSEGRSAANNNPLFTLGTDNTGLGPYATAFVRSDTGATSAMTGRKSTRPVFDNSWHHLVWTDANGQAKMYIDGVLDETDYSYQRPSVTLDLTYIGATARTTAANVPAPVTPYTGQIDDVATWNRVLTWTEIQQIRTNGVPVPDSVVLPPVITSHPPDRTNNIYTGDTVNFPVVVDGTPPFSYQWRKNGAPISQVANPSAITDRLVLNNVLLADSNTTYSVVVANGAASVTSRVALLYVKVWAPVTSGEALKMDVGLTGSPNARPGFAEFTLGNNPASFDGGVRVTMSGIGTSLAERNRVTGAMVANNPPLMTQAQIYNDFIFANSAGGDGTGISVLIERLAPSMAYGVTLWSFDPQSGGTRVSDWNESSSGTPVAIVTDYTFDGRVLPANDYQYTFGALVTSSPSGTLQFDGTRKPASIGTDGAPSFGVFLNALRLVANPVATGIINAALTGGKLRLTTETEYPGMSPNLEQTTNLASGAWVPATGGAIIESRGPVVVLEFPISETQMYYRGKQNP